jgi:hypothetical protein
MVDFEPDGDGFMMPWQHIKALILLPFTVAVVIPAIILH